MGFDVEIRGLGDAQRRLKRLQENLERLSETKSVPLRDLVTPEFLASRTRFRSLEELAREGGFLPSDGALTAERFESIPEAEWDAWIARATPFPGWMALLDAAAAEYIKRWLVDGL